MMTFCLVIVSAVLGVIGLQIVHDWFVKRYFPCKAGNASHTWLSAVPEARRHCSRCGLEQTGRQVMMGLGIVSEGETRTFWTDVKRARNGIDQ